MYQRIFQNKIYIKNVKNKFMSRTRITKIKIKDNPLRKSIKKNLIICQIKIKNRNIFAKIKLKLPLIKKQRIKFNSSK